MATAAVGSFSNSVSFALSCLNRDSLGLYKPSRKKPLEVSTWVRTSLCGCQLDTCRADPTDSRSHAK